MFLPLKTRKWNAVARKRVIYECQTTFTLLTAAFVVTKLCFCFEKHEKSIEMKNVEKITNKPKL